MGRIERCDSDAAATGSKCSKYVRSFNVHSDPKSVCIAHLTLAHSTVRRVACSGIKSTPHCLVEVNDAQFRETSGALHHAFDRQHCFFFVKTATNSLHACKFIETLSNFLKRQPSAWVTAVRLLVGEEEIGRGVDRRCHTSLEELSTSTSSERETPGQLRIFRVLRSSIIVR